MNIYSTATDEFVAAVVLKNGVMVTDTSSVTLLYLDSPRQPLPSDTWEPPTIAIDGVGVGRMSKTFSVGVYSTWAKIVDNPETPVVFCGRFEITDQLPW